MEPNSIVGIDVSKDRLDVHVLPSGQAWSVPSHLSKPVTKEDER